MNSLGNLRFYKCKEFNHQNFFCLNCVQNLLESNIIYLVSVVNVSRVYDLNVIAYAEWRLLLNTKALKQK